MEQQLVTKNTVIGDILAQNPEKAMELSQILMDFGIHCVGCMASGFETLEQGVLGHGYAEEELEVLVNGLNQAISEGHVEKEPEKKEFKQENFTLTLTSQAVTKVKDLIKNEAKEGEVILRVSVLAGGCSGFVYDLEIVKEKKEGDFVLAQEDLQIIVDNSSLEFLNGTEVDYLDTLNESGFRFNNPNSSKECGCGKSFS